MQRLSTKSEDIAPPVSGQLIQVKPGWSGAGRTLVGSHSLPAPLLAVPARGSSPNRAQKADNNFEKQDGERSETKQKLAGRTEGIIFLNAFSQSVFKARCD